MVHIGNEKRPAGRYVRSTFEVENPTVKLAQTLERFKLPISRMKTTTTPRVLTHSIDFSVLEKQPSDKFP
jgi:tRNA uridine 5-carboxymethylaminomethyl modification enzyme